ncbi:Xaa-Pro dipeptidyl-peptidase [uncultured Limosilactobacillus sp.]|uniref:Xaa-Pro dipeptidyl-peptidase n=1 Tax=uncultured Limosilactobacillus sp. TaxID=2837629 RepID=UPI0025DC5795|nr:Xaa-Pro dipeptidyl-peptidase [uncultured Limosilactobacillus sp.]
MKNNQFAIAPADHQQRITELQKIRLLQPDEEQQLTPNQLWTKLLTRIHVAGQTPALDHEWLNSLLATPNLSITDWLTQDASLTDDVFYLVALQLLQFEPAIDFDIHAPLAGMKKIQLPMEQHAKWTTANIIDAFYLLLNTRTKLGQNLLDRLTSQGMLTWTYSLPVNQKPIFFNGKPIASFDPTSFIREVVYVETDMDTDYDGQTDLVKVEIMRPVDSNNGLKVPAVFTASPYNQGTNDEWGEKITHNVNVPLTHKRAKEQSPEEPNFPMTFTKHSVNGESQTATESFSSTPAYTLNTYLSVRGYAIVYASGIGTKDSDGLQTCGSPEQTASMKAVVEWLHGDRRAFTDRTSGITIRADWCNGNVGMTGRSYLGTLATAVATTGVPGLKAIVSEAAISNWYDYYRENGLVMAPGGFQGEDADVLAAETFSRTKSPADYQRIETTNNRYLKGLEAAEDRSTGNYNGFWAHRNYMPNVDNIKCSVMMVHGLNDWNVKPVNVKNLYDALQGMPNTSKLILHQGQHIYINAFRSLDFSEMINLWFANKLWNLENHADDLLPNVLVQDNIHPETWTTYTNWSGNHSTTLNLTAHGLTTEQPTNASVVTFNDQQTASTYQQWCHHPADWSKALLNDRDGQFSAHFSSAPLKNDWLLRGTPTLKVRIAASVDHGLLSARLVDRGTAKRLTISPVILAKGGLELAYHFGTDDLREFQLQKQPTDAKVISYGHINLQNRHDASTVDDLVAGQFVDVELPLQPVFHTLSAGHQLELILFATDYEMTLRGNEAISYQIDPQNCSLILPNN